MAIPETKDQGFRFYLYPVKEGQRWGSKEVKGLPRAHTGNSEYDNVQETLVLGANNTGMMVK